MLCGGDGNPQTGDRNCAEIAGSRRPYSDRYMADTRENDLQQIVVLENLCFAVADGLSPLTVGE